VTRRSIEHTFAATAARRLRRVRDLLAGNAPDARRFLGRELHALSGEAMFLGFTTVCDLVRRAEELAAAWPGTDDAEDAAGPALRELIDAIAGALPPADTADLAAAPRAYIIADCVAHAWVLRDVLEHEGVETSVATDTERLLQIDPAIVICNVSTAQRLDPIVAAVRAMTRAAVVLVSSEPLESLAGDAARLGADGFVSTAAGLSAAVTAIKEHLA
jgi:hypothetical protein